jgi:Chromatin modification-related protein EAF7
LVVTFQNPAMVWGVRGGAKRDPLVKENNEHAHVTMFSLEQEILILQEAAYTFRPVGLTKHFEMAELLKRLHSKGMYESSASDLWQYTCNLYGLENLQEVYSIQQVMQTLFFLFFNKQCRWTCGFVGGRWKYRLVDLSGPVAFRK